MKPSRDAKEFFDAYVASDGPSEDTLPTFYAACTGDHVALHAVFSDYGRYGSGDNESWCDVPDVILEEIGDAAFAEFVRGADGQTRKAALRWLGPPDSTLSDERGLRRAYPRTARLQRLEFPGVEELPSDH